ncbi:MAG: DUF3604 domain-containing protein [Trueperaceae bacterium]
MITFGPWSSRLDRPDRLSLSERRSRHGGVVLTGPDEAVAGAKVNLRFEYRAGQEGLGGGSQLGMAWRLPGDWGEPQWDSASEPNYFASTTVPVEFEFGHRGGPAPWNHLLTLTLPEELPPNARLGLECRGWEVQTAVHRAHPFLWMIREEAGADWTRLPDTPELPIVAGQPREWTLVCPSECLTGEAFTLVACRKDVWGNPSSGSTPPELTARALEVLDRRRRGAADIWEISARLAEAGLYRIRLGEVEGNPMRCLDAPSANSTLWGDMHGGQCDLGCGQGDLDEYFTFARHVARLDFASHQANDVYVARDDWHYTRQVTEAHHQPGSFISYLGCEWTSMPPGGGDRNVFYLHDQPELYRAARWHEGGGDDWPLASTPPELYSRLARTDALINLHVGGFTSDLRWHEPRLERMIEIHSTHATSRWFVEDAVARGLRPAITAGSDSISGRPGSDHPGRRQSRNLSNGLTAVRAAGCDRNSIWEALRDGSCYATTGARMLLDVRREASDLVVDAVGTAAIEEIIVRRGGEVVVRRPLARLHPRRLRLSWWGSREKGTTRDQRLQWDGTLHADAALEVSSLSGFIAPIDTLAGSGSQDLAWRSVTAGNRASIDFTSQAQHFECRTPVHSFSCDRGGYYSALPEVVDGGISLGPAPDQEGAREASVRIRLAGEGVYWVEVMQVDGNAAFWGVIEI